MNEWNIRDENEMIHMDYSELMQRSYLGLYELNEKELMMVKQFY